MTNIFSFIAALAIGLICVAPPEMWLEPSNIANALGAIQPSFKADYVIPMMVNSHHWLFLVVASGLVAFYLLSQKLHLSLKILIVYLFIGSFFSQVPYFSFNAFILIAFTAISFLLMQKCNFKIITNMVQAVFWLELTIAVLRLMGKETLMNLGRPEPIFFGTIFQHMRFSSLLCLTAPFLLLKSKWYLIPISVAVILTKSSGFALAIGSGVFVYLLLDSPRFKWHIMAFTAAVVIIGCYLGRSSFYVAFTEGRIPVWLLCLKSWMFDTRVNPFGTPDFFGISQSGPFDLKCFLFGHGLDTFYPLFPMYKHDPNPFPQAHNCWIQILWELGLKGFGLLLWYCGDLIHRLFMGRHFILISGCIIIAVDMVFHFPTRQTQCMPLMIAYLALCEFSTNKETRRSHV